MTTGEVELELNRIETVSPAGQLPLQHKKQLRANEALRLEYRWDIWLELVGF